MTSEGRFRDPLDFLLGGMVALLALAIIKAPEIGDTLVYVNSILEFRSGHWTGAFNPLLEFGHLLWRPMGAALAPAFSTLIPNSAAWTLKLKIGYGLIVVNEIAAVLAAGLMFSLARRISGSAIAALATAIGLVWANGFLLYTKAGTDYVFCTAVEIAAIYLLAKPGEHAARWVRGGALLGLGALFWTPFALTVPAAAAIPWAIGDGAPKGKLRAWLTIAVTSGVVYIAVLAAGAWLAGVDSPARWHAWILAAQHGWTQTRRGLRAVSGVARLLFDLSNDGILLKRFLLKDPYHPVTIAGLIRLSLWKVGLYYALVAAIALAALRTGLGRRMLAVFAVAAIPMLFFAIFLFEPSSPERFLPVLPFLLLTAAAGCSGEGTGKWKWTQWAPAAMLLSVVPVNASAFLGSGTTHQLAAAQLEDFARSAAPGDLLVSIVIREPVTVLIEQQPFDPLLRGLNIPTYQVLGNTGLSRLWRKELARRVLAQWTAGSDVWITKWGLQERPAAELGWVEGDDPDVRWHDVPAFLSQLEFDSSTARPDGFVRLARSDRNRAMLGPLANGTEDERK